jgi:hypothetical protein
MKQTKFFPGDLVEVRPLNEILATLDGTGTLEKLPFMPEMTALAGRQFRVTSRAFKTCVDDAEMRRLDKTRFSSKTLRCEANACRLRQACPDFLERRVVESRRIRHSTYRTMRKSTESGLDRVGKSKRSVFLSGDRNHQRVATAAVLGAKAIHSRSSAQSHFDRALVQESGDRFL